MTIILIGLLVKINPRYLRESVYGMGAVLMYNFGKDNLNRHKCSGLHAVYNG